MFMLIKLLSFNLLTHSPDVNECAGNVSVCDEHANCTDSEGSFLCTCNTGFSGDGYNCSSEILASIKLHTILFILQISMNARLTAMYVMIMLYVKIMWVATSVCV